MEYSRRAALFVLKNDKGELLLQLRDEEAPTAPGFWAFFGGGIEKGESPEEAVRREAEEELGIELLDLEFFKRYVFRHEEGLREKFVFTAPLTFPVEELRKSLREGKDLGLHSEESVSKLKVTEDDKRMLRDVFANFNGEKK
jgi:8-oxo-dGTP diphosphatase